MEHLLPLFDRYDRILIFDTETTGLSGGAGTVVFLLGLGVVQGNRLFVRQAAASAPRKNRAPGDHPAHRHHQ